MINQIKMLVCLLFVIAFNTLSNSQGCVAIRGNASCSIPGNANSLNLNKGEFQIQTGLRYFKSFRHFRGSEEESNRVAEGTEVINHSYFLDVSLNYGVTNRFFANMTLPYVHHNRSSMYEHGGNGLGDRHETMSSGLADIRLGIGYWLLDPATHKSNYSFGLGIKLPTGKYDAMDKFYNQGTTKTEIREGVVDQSIQPGDGGTCIVLEAQGLQILSNRFSLASNLYYLISPQETNGVLTRSGTSEFSCPDQIAARLGAYYNPNNHINTYLGGRLEVVTSSDLIGGSAGFRRPGYAISIEPGVGYAINNLAFNFSIPIAAYRNRTQSYEDKLKTESTGVFTQGDAAFADYLINFSASYRFGHHPSM